MRVSTVYLKGPWAPDGKDYLSGYVSDYPKCPSVEVSARDDFRGNTVQIPRENIARIEIDTGWR
jgi:hypothetical protein